VLHDGISVAIRTYFHNLIVERDNNIVVRALQGKNIKFMTSSVDHQRYSHLEKSNHSNYYQVYLQITNMPAYWLSKFDHPIIGLFTTNLCFLYISFLHYF